MASYLLLGAILAFAFFRPVFPAIIPKSFDYPTANLSTVWTISSSLPRNISYSDGSFFLPLLLVGHLGPSFSLGFICYPPCSLFLLSISIVITNSASGIVTANALPQVVWCPNFDRPVRLNASLSFTLGGDLILRDSDGNAVWSTGTAGRNSTALSLLDSGNLVLVDSQMIRIWDSFDHPSDSLVVGQALKQGQMLTSNSSNPLQPLFYFTVSANGLYAFVDSQPPQLYYQQLIFSSSSKSQNISPSYAVFNNGSLDLYVIFTNPNAPDYRFTFPRSPYIQFMRLDSSGRLGLYAWNSEWNLVRQVLSVFPDDCAYPSACGRYGICIKGQCSCPQAKDGGDYRYFRAVDELETNLGCALVTPISCKMMERHQLVTVDGASYFNYIDPNAAAMQHVTVETCKEACLSDCSCKAALFQYKDDLTDGTCYLPSEVFSLMVNDPNVTHYNSSAFLKVQPALSAPRNTLNRRKKLIIGVTIPGGFALVCFIIVVSMQKRRRWKQLAAEDCIGDIPGMQARYSYEQLKKATENFKNKVGKGGFGTVYEGTLRNGVKVAVKRLDGIGRAKNEFLAEMKTLVGIHHINLVRLIGYCAEKEHRLLVFEFMSNGSLEKWIFNKTQNSSLDWQTKCKIITDIARGLSYLHEGCTQRIAHLDIKPQNILLDKNFNAKIADLGLAKLIERDQDQVMTRMRGTPGYLAPEWLTSVISEKVDVFSFGIVVMEIVCGRKNLDFSRRDATHLISLLQEKARDGQILDLINVNIKGSRIHEHDHGEEAVAMLKLAIWCLQTDTSRRPSMSMVVKVLDGNLDLETDLNYNFFTASALISNNAFDMNASIIPTDSLLSGPR